MKLRDTTESKIRRILSDKEKHRRRLAVVTALAVLTGGNVFWELREIGTALTGDQLCAMEAHEHTASCFDEDGELTCTLAEHVHSAECFSDPQADLETPDIWEQSFVWQSDAPRQEQAAQIAESQLGMTESTRNFVLSEDGTRQGYTRYGDWYGNPYGEWNTMFTYFCVYYAGVTTEEMPCGGNARTWQIKLKENELLRPPDSAPERGNVVFLDDNADGEADRTGIVTSVQDTLTVIEGDRDNAVKAVQYALDDAQILGFVTLPEPEPTAEPPTVVQPEILYYTAESPGGIQVTASAETGIFPEHTVMTVTDISREEALQTAAEGLAEDAGVLDAVAVDISFLAADGTELEPTGNVDVQITLPETQQLAGEDFTLLHVQDDGAIETLDAEIDGESAVFTAEGFSVFVFVAGQPKPLDSLVMVNGQPGGNSESNPYVVHVGDTIDVFMTGNENITVVNNQSSVNSSQNKLESLGYATQAQVTYEGVTYSGMRKQYRALLPEPVTIHNGQDYLYLDILDQYNQYFVWNYGMPVPSSQATMLNGSTGGNAEDNPYVVYVGETFDVFLAANATSNGYFSLPTNEDGGVKKLEVVGSQSFEPITYNETSINGCTRTFKAIHPGTLKCQTYDGNPKQDFYIKVIDPEIYVKTLYEDKPIDRVKEHLNNYNLQNDEGYVPNGVGQTEFTATPRPYVIRQGDEFEIHIPGAVDYSVTNYDLSFDPTNDMYNYLLAPSSEQKISLISSSYEDGMTILRFKGNDVATDSEVEIKFPRLNRSMWVRVFSKRENFTHADMEIADGGTYTVTSVGYENGQPYTMVSLYDAHIVKVNDAWVMGNDPSQALSHFEVGDYEPLNAEGSTQYELTSAFKCLYNREKHYNANDARSAIFNVNVELKPTAIYRLDASGNSQLIRQYTREESIANAEIHESIRFDLGQQEIIDAMNKCPMTNGLDFTIRANAAVVKLQAIKNLNGGLLADDQFTFELVDETGNVVSTATNNQKGEVVFLDQVYTEPGTYKYTIREAAEGRDPKMLYDESAQEITVTVREVEGPNETSFLMAEIAGQPEFTNYVTYRLPDTGGNGNTPYYLGGIVIVTAAVLLYDKKRRKNA